MSLKLVKSILFKISWVLATHEKSAEEHQTKIIESVNSDEVCMHVYFSLNLFCFASFCNRNFYC